MIEKFKYELEIIEGWAKSCETNEQLMVTNDFFRVKLDKAPDMSKFSVSRNGLLEIGNAVGRVMAIITYKADLLKKE